MSSPRAPNSTSTSSRWTRRRRSPARRGRVVGITAAASVGSIALFKLVPQQFFPASDRPELMLDLKMPHALTYEASEREVRTLEEALRGDPDVVAVTRYVGNGSPRFYLPLDA